jgi:hypothetical protein
MKGTTSQRLSLLLLVAVPALLSFACSEGMHRYGIPAGAQAVLDTSIEDIDAGRYEKLYLEAADEWRNSATLDESKATFKTLRDKLGSVRTRNSETAREEQTSTGPIAGHSLVVVYQTSFEHGEGMETFTLLEHGGRWYLARYFVTSNELR